MSFDPIAAKKIITALQVRRQQPGGDVMEQAATLLQEAVSESTLALSQVRTAEAEASRSRRLYDDTLIEIKGLKETEALCQRAIAVLQEVAETKKGAANKAREWLLSIGRMPPSAAPASPKPEAAP